jgi:glycosyltransferase involved in cell wall biosynthesis
MIENYNIAIVGRHTYCGSGGTAVHPTEIARVLSKRNKVFFVTTWDHIGGLDAAGSHNEVIHENDNLTVYVEKARHHGKALQKIKRAYLIRNNVDLFHIHDFRLGLLGVIESKRPIILTVHGYLIETTAKDSLLYWTYLKLMKKTVKRADAVIAVDKTICNWLEHEIVNVTDKLYCIPNGADINKFSPSLDGSEIREIYGISNSDQLIFCARYFYPKNAVESTIEAVPMILKEYPNTKLMLAGKGPSEDKLKNLVRKLDLNKNVIFCGEVTHDNIPKYFAAADVIVNSFTHISGVEEFETPSLLDALETGRPIGTSIATLEALSTGKPVITSTVGGVKKEVSDREIGILLPDKNPKALADAVLHIFNDPKLARRLGKNAREYIIANRSWDKIVEQISEVYARALEK